MLTFGIISKSMLHFELKPRLVFIFALCPSYADINPLKAQFFS